MWWICLIFMVLAGLLLPYYLKEKIKSYSVKSVLIKTAISILFVAVAIYSAYVSKGHKLSPFVITGLLFGLTGDIWLDLKYVYPKDDKIYSYAGFIVFGIGHVLFITGLYLEFFNKANVLYIIIPLILAGFCGVLTQILAKPLKLNYGDMKWIVFIYSLTLFSLPLCSGSLLLLHSFNNMTLTLIFAGGLLFAISDLVLSGTYFGKGHETPLDFICNYLTYYPAQFLIAFSLFFL